MTLCLWRWGAPWKEHAVFKIKYNQDYSTKLLEISIVDKIYDFESYHVLNLIL